MRTKEIQSTDIFGTLTRAAERIPQLRGVCVVVAGADVSSACGAAIREFWNKYFEAAGTSVSPDNYRNMISDPSEIACPATME